MTVAPRTAGAVRLQDAPEPGAAIGSAVVDALAVGICGTAAEIASGHLHGLTAQNGEPGVALVSFEPVDDPRTAREEERAAEGASWEAVFLWLGPAGITTTCSGMSLRSRGRRRKPRSAQASVKHSCHPSTESEQLQ